MEERIETQPHVPRRGERLMHPDVDASAQPHVPRRGERLMHPDVDASAQQHLFQEHGIVKSRRKATQRPVVSKHWTWTLGEIRRTSWKWSLFLQGSDQKRQAFSKRKRGIILKACQLHKLTDAKVIV
jgi:hypothetical protein